MKSRGCVFNPLEFIYAVNSSGLVKGMGLAGERVQAELAGMHLKSPTRHLSCELFGAYEKDVACIGRGSELNS